MKRTYGPFHNTKEEHPAKCVATLATSYQCDRKSGHGPDGLYCVKCAKRIPNKTAA